MGCQQPLGLSACSDHPLREHPADRVEGNLGRVFKELSTRVSAGLVGANVAGRALGPGGATLIGRRAAGGPAAVLGRATREECMGRGGPPVGSQRSEEWIGVGQLSGGQRAGRAAVEIVPGGGSRPGAVVGRVGGEDRAADGEGSSAVGDPTAGDRGLVFSDGREAGVDRPVVVPDPGRPRTRWCCR
jgi:hypothetical protein